MILYNKTPEEIHLCITEYGYDRLDYDITIIPFGYLDLGPRELCESIKTLVSQGKLEIVERESLDLCETNNLRNLVDFIIEEINSSGATGTGGLDPDVTYNFSGGDI